MYNGERALAVAVIDKAVEDFVGGCEMYSEARKSLEKKGTYPNGYGTAKSRFDSSLSFFLPKSKEDRIDLVIWSDMAGMDPDVLIQKFRAILRGEAKLNGKPAYPYIRDMWYCEAYKHNFDLIDMEKQIKEVQDKMKRVSPDGETIKQLKKQYKDLSSKISFAQSQTSFRIKRQEERMENLNNLKMYMDKNLFFEKMEDCKRLISIYKDKYCAAITKKLLVKEDGKDY